MTNSSTLVDLLRWRSVYQPDRRAFSFIKGDDDNDVNISYAELDRRASAVAALVRREAAPGERALLLYPSGLDYVAAFLGCLYANVVAVPVYPPNPRLERTLLRLRAIMRDARPSVVLTTSTILPMTGRLAASDEVFAAARWLASDRLEDAGSEPLPGPDLDSLAFLQYTSGSTNTPKGVMVSHGNLMHNAAVIERAAGLSEESAAVSWLPLYHDMGLIGLVVQPIHTGFPVALMPPVDFLQKPLRWLRAITRYRATLSGAPNFAYDLCVSHTTPEQRAALDLSSWTVAANGAEPVRPETLERFAEAFAPHGFRREAFFPCYGLAESTLLVTGGPVGRPPVVVHADRSGLRHGRVTVLAEASPDTSALVSSGRVPEGKRVVVVDPETRVPCAPGRVGEIWVASASVSRGYWNTPEATEQTFAGRLAERDEGDFLRTGDLGFVHDGELFVTSRLKDLIIIRGANHAPQDIERTVEGSHPALRPGCGVAFSVDVDAEERLVVVYEVRREHLSVDAEEVAAAARAAVADEHELEVYAVVLLRTGSLPKTSSGKLQRRACRDEYLRGTLRQIGQSVRDPRPRSPQEEEPGAALAAVLEAAPARRLPMLVAYLSRRIAAAVGAAAEQVAADEPLIALGLDSLRLLEIKQRVETELGVAMPLEWLADHPTVGELAAAVLDEIERNVSGVRTDVAGLGDRPPGTVEPDPAARHDPFPLTEIQQAYWIGRGGGYDFGDVSIHAYVEVDGVDVDLARLGRTWQRVVSRHDMLRAVVLPDGRQRILPEVPAYEIDVLDLRGRDADSVADALAAVRDDLSHQVLDAQAWPGFDIRASLLDGGRTRVHISVDLLHVDGGSLMIVVDEWMRLYGDGDADLPPLELSYRDYVLGEIALHESDAYRRSAAYWRERVATLPPAPALPMRPGGAGGRTRFRRRRAALEPGTWTRLKSRAGRAGLTPSAVLLAAYADVLGCWSEDDAFTLNVTLFNRLPVHPQVNRIVGDFTSMILLGVESSAGAPFTARASAIQRDLLTGLDHRHVSGVQVLRELARAQRLTTGAPMPIVFTSMLDLAGQGFRPPLPALRALGDVVHSVTQTPQVWLDLQVLEEDGALVLTLDAVEDLFPAGLPHDAFAAYERFLRRLADDDAAWQDRDRAHVPPEQLAQRAEVNATAAPVPDDTLLTLFLRQAGQSPHSPAVITSDGMLTYADLRRRANRLGHRLRALGAEPDTLVAVVMDKGAEQVVATLGIHLAGAAYLPVDPRLPAERRDYLFDHGQVRIAVTQPWLDRDLEWPPNVVRVALDADDPADDEALLAPVQRPDHLSHVIYTSGSTGLPKGVMVEHRNVVNRIVDVNQRLGVGPADRVLALTALHHDLSVYDVFGVLAAGAALVVPDAARVRDPEHWAQLMAAHGVTLWNSVPAFLQMLVEYLEQRADRPDLVPRSLRRAVLAGDWIPVTLPDRLRSLVDGVEVIASGGPTETTIWDIWYPVDKVDPDWQSIPYGTPMTNTRYHVLDAALRPRPTWVPGELYIGGAGLARGYWRDEAKTGERFIVHPGTGERLYRSGDLGRYLPDGTIEFLGRADFQVKIRGHRIEPGEIEATLQQHPAVDAAVVTAVGERRRLERLVAYVVPRRRGGATGQAGPAGANPNGAEPTRVDPAGKSAADFDERDLEGISVLDPVARIDFKLQQWGVRRDTDRETIALGAVEPDEQTRRMYTHRRSVRDFAPTQLPLEAFDNLLRALTQIELDGLPKYRYGSGGGLYPVQTYLYVKPGRVEGVPGGVYYHDPREHRLLLMSADPRIDAGTQAPHNRDVFDRAAFAVFLVGRLAAVQPMYGRLARDFCLLEAGAMSQLLMSVAPDHGIGLCPVGSMDFAAVRRYFDLDDHDELVHLLVGGPVTDEAAPPAAAAGTAVDGGLVDELRAFLRGTLPEQLQPSAYVLLDSLPLTSNGKVDRRRLPAPDQADEPAQPDVPPRNEVERTLAAIVRDVLGIERLSVHQNFFDLGGDSIHMVRILNRVRTEFGRDMPVTDIFRYPSISSLARRLSENADDATALEDSDQRASQRRAALARRDARKRQRSDSGGGVDGPGGERR